MSIERLQKRLEAIPKRVKESVQPTLQRNGKELASTMQHLAPVSADGSHGNPPGALRDSIQVTVGGSQTPPYSIPGGSMTVPENAVAITAGNVKVRYCHLVEFGSIHGKAQPYFWPAYRLMKRKMQSSIKRAIGKAVREGWNA